MALQYDAPTGRSDVIAALEGNGSLSDDTLDALREILGLNTAGTQVNVASFDGTDVQSPTGDVELVVAEIAGGAGQNVDVTLPTGLQSEADAFVFDSKADLKVNFAAGGDRVIAMSGGDDTVTVAGSGDTTLDGGAGDDTLATGSGDDVVTGGSGDDTVDAGAGDDVVYAGEGNDTVAGGSGFDTVVFAGEADDFTIETSGTDGLVITNKSTGAVTTITDAEFIEFADGGSVAVATDNREALALRLYQGLLDRSADRGGAQFWVDLADSQLTLEQLAMGFMNSPEYQAANVGLSDTAFITKLYENALGRAPEPEGLAYHLASLAQGVSRASVAVHIVGSPEAAGSIDSVVVLPGAN